jgi:WD40 repeat protein
VHYLKGTNFFASGSSDKTIKIWNATDGSLINTITGHDVKLLLIKITSGRCAFTVSNIRWQTPERC